MFYPKAFCLMSKVKQNYFENTNVGGKSVGKKELEKFLKEFRKILHL